MMPGNIPLEGLMPSRMARPLDQGVVTALVESMGRLGLLQAILVRPAAVMRGGVLADGWRIVAGHHRAEAARLLGWETIPAQVMANSDGELQAELMEIDENLIRAELSPAQRAAAIKRRKVIWDALHPESGTNCPTLPATGRGHVQFAADTAQAANMTKRDINRHLSRADALGDDLQKVEGTSLDKGVELDALKAMPPEVRAPLIARAQAGEPVSARKPAARISLSIEYYDVQDGASSLAFSIIRRDRDLAMALLNELNRQLLETA